FQFGVSPERFDNRVLLLLVPEEEGSGGGQAEGGGQADGGEGADLLGHEAGQETAEGIEAHEEQHENRHHAAAERVRHRLLELGIDVDAVNDQAEADQRHDGQGGREAAHHGEDRQRQRRGEGAAVDQSSPVLLAGEGGGDEPGDERADAGGGHQLAHTV